MSTAGAAKMQYASNIALQHLGGPGTAAGTRIAMWAYNLRSIAHSLIMIV